MKNNFNHLYIHIPFCKHICTFCDFVRKIPKNINEMTMYVDLLIKEINQINHKLKTIYIGGGTPNFLNHDLLEKLLISLQKNICNETEFSIECNPEFVNENQAQLFSKYNVNRISLGVQTTNENILQLLNRKHNINDCESAIKILNKFNIYNISADFIYNLPFLKLTDLDDAIEFCKKNSIKHISFYALEIKENSILNKQNYKIDVDIEEDQLEYINQIMVKNNFYRYEVSNWTVDKKYQSKHNLAYWRMQSWQAIGYGAYGFINNQYFNIVGDFLNWTTNKENIDTPEMYQYILIMGLRLIEGINLEIEINRKAYDFYKQKINPNLIIIENNYLKAKNIDLLNDILIDII